jgi:hypothetical protein
MKSYLNLLTLVNAMFWMPVNQKEECSEQSPFPKDGTIGQ